MEYATPMDEIHAVRQKISAAYNHNPHLYFKAVVERQKERARQGRVYWGYNAAGELAPLPVEVMLAR